MWHVMTLRVVPVSCGTAENFSDSFIRVHGTYDKDGRDGTMFYILRFVLPLEEEEFNDKWRRIFRLQARAWYDEHMQMCRFVH